MDGDLQDLPEVIPQFVERYNQGYDVVYAKRVRRKEPWPLRLCYFAFYRLLAGLPPAFGLRRFRFDVAPSD